METNTTEVSKLSLFILHNTSTEQWMVDMVQVRIAAGETTVGSKTAVLRCEMQMKKLPH